MEALDTEDTVESIEPVRGIFAGGSCRDGLEEVDIVGEVGGELVKGALFRNGSLTVLAVTVGRADGRDASEAFSAISSFRASAAAASRISSSRGSGAALLAGFGGRGRSRMRGVESAMVGLPCT